MALLAGPTGSSRTLVRSYSRVVIAGAGIIGNSVAYHLGERGWKDVLVLDQSGIGSGSSDVRSGVIGLFKPTAMRAVVAESAALYGRLEDVGFRRSGCVYVAQTLDRTIALRRRMAYNVPAGLRCERLLPREAEARHPLLRTDDIEGAVWVSEDAAADPKAVCLALSRLARANGVQYEENCAVKEVLSNGGRVDGVITDRGHVPCEVFVNCAGMWARELGLNCTPQVRIPVYPAQHFSADTDLVVPEGLPCLKDYDGSLYALEDRGRLTVGWHEKDAKPAFGISRIPKDWRRHLREDPGRLAPLRDKAVHRIPSLKGASIADVVNTVDAFTPDGRWILGEAPEVKNYFVGCGTNGNPLQGGGGIGKIVADWIANGKPEMDLLPFNIARFLDLHNNRQYLHQRTKEIVGRQYSILYPHQCEYKKARKLRCSPLYSVLEKRGAVFGIKMGYERALYFDTSKGNPYPRLMPPGSFFKPKFFDYMLREYNACRESVGIIDMSSFSKVEICSINNEVVDYLQYLCSNDIDVPIGSLVHTGMQNEKGGYENDCMLVRLAPNAYFMVSPTSQQTRIFEWMSRHLPGDHSVELKDVTSMYTVINVVGPKSHELMSELSGQDVKLSPMTMIRVDIGYVSDVMVMAFTHTGEPGYCLYVPSEYALHIYNNLMKVGKDHGARDVGTLTQRFMRIERFIPFWGEELNSMVTPFEAGNELKVKFEKNFIGREALLDQKEKGVTKRLVMFHMIDFDAEQEIWPWGGEPIYRNDEYVGGVTCAGYGFTANKLVCLGFIKSSEGRAISDEYILDRHGYYEIDIAGHRFPVKPYLYPPYIPIKSYKKKSQSPITSGRMRNLTNEL